MKTFCIYVAVIVCGAAVLAIEMLGTRILGPFYGVSLYLWSALISVTLAALSLGYAIGGRWADRGPTLQRFATVIGLAGLWIALIPWLRGPVLGVAEPLGLRAAVLLGATLLFFPPLAFLGMVSPYAIRLKTSSLDVVGTTAGNLYAVSTVASVLSALATGFVLIPNVGVYTLVTIIGVALLVTAAIVAFLGGRRRPVLPALMLAVAAIVILAPGGTDPKAHPDEGLVAIQQSLYGEIRVVDIDDTRHLLIDGTMHTVIDRITGESRLSYVNVLDLALEFFTRPGEVLVVGLGGGSAARRFAAAGWTVDAVEIDPVVTAMAYAHFGLKPEEATVYEMDARQYLITHDKQYDLIIMDAFGGSAVPFHLVTQEAFALLHSRLRPGGMLAMNAESVGWHDVLIESLLATVKTGFQDVVALPMAEPPDQLGNVVLLAADYRIELPVELPVPLDRFSPEYDRAHAWDNRFRAEEAGARIITDDLNPVDVWSERINLTVREQLREYFGGRAATW
jgi:spermidine synthase